MPAPPDPPEKTVVNRHAPFASLLVERGHVEDGAPLPPRMQVGLPAFDAQAQASNLRSPPGFAAAGYADHQPVEDERPGAPAEAQRSGAPERSQPPPSLDPAAIAAELPLECRDAAVLVRARRDFAFRNHPDRAAAHLRDRALRRMQIANGLIDAALRRAAARNSS